MTKDLFSVRNKLAVVTGGSSGIGLSMATFLVEEGCKVILVNSKTSLEEIKYHFKNLSKNVSSIIADLSKENGIMESGGKILKEYGTPDILINAAGVNLRESPEDITFSSWNKTLDINLKAPFFFSRVFIDKMKLRGSGKIINIASLQSVRAFDNSIPYGASKGGITQLTRAMAQAYSKFGINVNAIAPGFFKTNLTLSVFQNKEKAEELAEKTAIGRNGCLDDFEGITLFLCSSASNYITGQTIFLDGGFTAK